MAAHPLPSGPTIHRQSGESKARAAARRARRPRLEAGRLDSSLPDLSSSGQPSYEERSPRAAANRRPGAPPFRPQMSGPDAHRVPLATRHALPWLVGIAWLALTFLALPPGLSDFEHLTWGAALFFTMIVVDRLYVAFVRRRHGVDPMKLHWSQLRNRDGAFFCAACQSVFLLPPEDLSDEGMVHCGDCGHAVARYGEMRPLIHVHGQRLLGVKDRHISR
jgi:hypothetical protein